MYIDIEEWIIGLIAHKYRRTWVKDLAGSKEGLLHINFTSLHLLHSI